MPCVTATRRLIQQIELLLLNDSISSIIRMVNGTPKCLLDKSKCQTQVMEHNTLDHHKVNGWMGPGEFGLSEEVAEI